MWAQAGCICKQASVAARSRVEYLRVSTSHVWRWWAGSPRTQASCHSGRRPVVSRLAQAQAGLACKQVAHLQMVGWLPARAAGTLPGVPRPPAPCQQQPCRDAAGARLVCVVTQGMACARRWTQVLPCSAGGVPLQAHLAGWLAPSAGMGQEAHLGVGHYEDAGGCVGLECW